MNKFKIVFILALFCLASCKQQESVNPVSTNTNVEVATEEDDLVKAFVYKNKTYSREAWNKRKDHRELELNSFVILENEVAFLFDTQEELESFDTSKYRIDISGGPTFTPLLGYIELGWIKGGIAGGNMNGLVSSLTKAEVREYYQCKIRFWEHANFGGKFLEYRINGIRSRMSEQKYRIPSNWRNRISCLRIDEMVQPQSVEKVTVGVLGIPLHTINFRKHSHLRLTVYNNTNWEHRGVDNSRAWRNFNGLGDFRQFDYINRTVNFGAACGGTSAVYNDKIGSFKINATIGVGAVSRCNR
jgi:hypothetical protein